MRPTLDIHYTWPQTTRWPSRLNPGERLALVLRGDLTWRQPHPLISAPDRPRRGPANILVERADGERVVAPFRGMRRG